ncbi:putative DNA-binding domain-containing protein [Actinomadura graeca]|uniref:DNA-binding domain-containing protein n=1 Tax=Actinomadura graeca TaxID=2750812 RepID=A0ABX8QTW1_9ACTN|nr:DNA-binding domain-containing protein [Actinomadura graeca]QXJ22198.1 putative DNA-binding domain-containing protein [Actinomadura graeca]
MPEPSELALLQRWMQEAILDADAAADDVEETLTASSTLNARQRLGIYWRGYRLRLLETMRGMHPGLTHLLGEEMFDRFALDYLDARPSRAYTLSRLDEGFTDHLSTTRPDAGDPEGWPDLIIDLARLERIAGEVIDGPGTEDGPLLRPADLPGGAALRCVRLVPAPCLHLPDFAFPVNEYLAAVRRGEDPAPPPPRPVRLAVHRRDYRVTTRELDPAAHRALRALAGGATVGAALGGTPEAADRLRRWTDLGYFAAVHRPATAAPPHTEERATR